MNIKLYKTLGGQEIIAEVVEEGIGWVTLAQVLVLRPEQTDTGYVIRMLPFSPTVPEGKWKYYLSAFMGEPVELPENLKTAYLQETSRIQIVSNLDSLGRK